MKLSQNFDMKIPHIFVYGLLKGIEGFFKGALKHLECKGSPLLGQ